jgi:hypothetical protein
MKRLRITVAIGCLGLGSLGVAAGGVGGAFAATANGSSAPPDTRKASPAPPCQGQFKIVSKPTKRINPKKQTVKAVPTPTITIDDATRRQRDAEIEAANKRSQESLDEMQRRLDAATTTTVQAKPAVPSPTSTTTTAVPGRATTTTTAPLCP